MVRVVVGHFRICLFKSVSTFFPRDPAVFWGRPDGMHRLDGDCCSCGDGGCSAAAMVAYAAAATMADAAATTMADAAATAEADAAATTMADAVATAVADAVATAMADATATVTAAEQPPSPLYSVLVIMEVYATTHFHYNVTRISNW